MINFQMPSAVVLCDSVLREIVESLNSRITLHLLQETGHI